MRVLPFSHLALVFCTIIISLWNAASAQQIRWHDASDFQVEGRGWSDTAGPFDRLPDSAENKVSEVAWRMSKNSSGISVRFVTNASTVYTSWTLTSETLDMPHMPATGVSGLDLYARDSAGSWRFIGNGRPHFVLNQASFTFPEYIASPRECLLYLPIYNGVQGVEIGVPEDSSLESAAPRPAHLSKPIVVYGTSITQGGCASRPGMVWTSILGRSLDRPIINLGFSSSGSMKPPIGEVLAELDPAAYIIDCLWNIGDASQKTYTLRVSILVKSIREKHPLTPIFFVGQTMINPQDHPTPGSIKQEAVVRALQNDGDKNLIVIPATNLIGSDGEGTVDGIHFNDLGMERHARNLEAFLQGILPNNE